MTTTFKTARIGDRVWHLEYGWGVVVDITAGDYPIAVDFENDYYEVVERFTFEGKFRLAPFNQTLFWDEIEIVAPSKPLPDLPVDTKVLVWMDGGVKVARHLSHLVEQGKAVCYDDGQTSWTTRGRHTVWDNWELAD